MAQNYNLGSSFGLNVSQKNTKSLNAQNKEINVEKAVGDLFDSMTGYVAKYENVFNGDVEKQIGMYSRQAMIVSMNLKAVDDNKRNFDMNI